MNKKPIFITISALLFCLSSQSKIQASSLCETLPYDTLQNYHTESVMNRQVFTLRERSLTDEEKDDVERSLSPTLIEQCYDACQAGNREFLYNIHRRGNTLIVKNVIDASIDSIPISQDCEATSLITNKGHVRDKETISLLRDLVENRVFFPTLAMNLHVHQRLAQLSAERHPLAQWYLAKVLKHFSVKKNDELEKASDLLLSAAKTSFQVLLESEENLTSSLKGLCCEYLGEGKRAAGFFLEGTDRGEILSHHRIAQIKEQAGESDALEYYEKAFILGYEKSLYDIARQSDDENSAFLHFKKAGTRGNPEAYTSIAKMIRNGFIPLTHPSGELWGSQEFWLIRGVELNSLSSALSLGELYERQGKIEEAISVYGLLRSSGNIRGYLEQGRVLENQRRFGECEKIYKEPNAGWFGLYALAEITPEKEKKNTYKKQASEMFHKHFGRIIDIAVQGL